MTPTPATQQSDYIIKWLSETLLLQPGEEHYLPCNNREAMKNLMKVVRKELAILEKIDPISGTSLHAYCTYKEKRHWVVLKRVVPELDIGFKKDASGKVSKVSLFGGQERKRRISLMREDGLSWEEIEELEGTLTEEEKNVLG